jgi:hypothetical protein
MSRVILPHTFENADIVNPQYVNENFEALAEAANSLGPGNIESGSIPQSALESPMAVGQIVVPFGTRYVDLAIDNGEGGDDQEYMLAVKPEDGDQWMYAGNFPIDITIVNVSWCFREYSGDLHGHIVVADRRGVGLAAVAFDVFKLSPVAHDDWDIGSPAWVDSRECNVGWNADKDLWVGIHSLTETDAAADNYLYQNMSITLTYKYGLFL